MFRVRVNVDSWRRVVEIFIGIAVAAAALAGIILLARRFLKPVEGPLHDCCGGNGNKDLQNNL